MGMNILHIDDSPEICQLYSDYYSQKNHNITSETDARKGLELVLENDYDFILLDMCMPHYDGMNFLHDVNEGTVILSYENLEDAQKMCKRLNHAYESTKRIIGTGH